MFFSGYFSFFYAEPEKEPKMLTRRLSFGSMSKKKESLGSFVAPQSTMEVNFELLHSEAIILPGMW